MAGASGCSTACWGIMMACSSFGPRRRSRQRSNQPIAPAAPGRHRQLAGQPYSASCASAAFSAGRMAISSSRSSRRTRPLMLSRCRYSFGTCRRPAESTTTSSSKRGSSGDRRCRGRRLAVVVVPAVACRTVSLEVRPSRMATTRSTWWAMSGSWLTMMVVTPVSLGQLPEGLVDRQGGRRVHLAGRLIGQQQGEGRWPGRRRWPRAAARRPTSAADGDAGARPSPRCSAARRRGGASCAR